MTAERTTQIRTTRATVAALREIAAACELYVGRGVGAGEVGNPADLLERLAERYRANPVGVLAALAPIVVGSVVGSERRELANDGGV